MTGDKLNLKKRKHNKHKYVLSSPHQNNVDETFLSPNATKKIKQRIDQTHELIPTKASRYKSSIEEDTNCNGEDTDILLELLLIAGDDENEYVKKRKKQTKSGWHCAKIQGESNFEKSYEKTKKSKKKKKVHNEEESNLSADEIIPESLMKIEIFEEPLLFNKKSTEMDNSDEGGRIKIEVGEVNTPAKEKNLMFGAEETFNNVKKEQQSPRKRKIEEISEKKQKGKIIEEMNSEESVHDKKKKQKKEFHSTTISNRSDSNTVGFMRHIDSTAENSSSSDKEKKKKKSTNKTEENRSDVDWSTNRNRDSSLEKSSSDKEKKRNKEKSDFGQGTSDKEKKKKKIEEVHSDSDSLPKKTHDSNTEKSSSDNGTKRGEESVSEKRKKLEKTHLSHSDSDNFAKKKHRDSSTEKSSSDKEKKKKKPRDSSDAVQSFSDNEVTHSKQFDSTTALIRPFDANTEKTLSDSEKKKKKISFMKSFNLNTSNDMQKKNKNEEFSENELSNLINIDSLKDLSSEESHTDKDKKRKKLSLNLEGSTNDNKKTKKDEVKTSAPNLNCKESGSNVDHKTNNRALNFTNKEIDDLAKLKRIKASISNSESFNSPNTTMEEETQIQNKTEMEISTPIKDQSDDNFNKEFGSVLKDSLLNKTRSDSEDDDEYDDIPCGQAMPLLSTSGTLDLYEITDDEAFRLGCLTIVNPFEVAPLHQIHTRSTRPTKQQRDEIQKLGFKVKRGMYSQKEDKIILANWKHFCQLHDWPEDEMGPFTMFTSEKKRTLKFADITNFLQILGHGLDDRLLYSIYQRFQRLAFGKLSHAGRFTLEEDDIILDFMKKTTSNRPFLELGKLLNRPRNSILRHYKFLLSNGGTRIRWDKERIRLFLKNLLKILNCTAREDLRYVEISTNQWQKLSKSMDDIPVKKLQRVWNLLIYPRLFVKNTDVNEVKLDLIEHLLEKGVDDWREVNWNDVAKHFEGYTGNKLYEMLKHLIVAHLPSESKENLRDTLLKLKSTICSASEGLTLGRCIKTIKFKHENNL